MITERQKRLETIKQVKRLMFKHPISFPGGYSHRCYMTDSELICADCLLENWASIVQSTLHGFRDGWQVFGVDIYWEGPAVECAHCYKLLESEYGDPEMQDVDEEHDSGKGELLCSR